jgi:cell division transport system permease protein
VLVAVALAVVAVVANTIRLTVLAKRDTIEVMKVVGASEWFIRMPFLYEGMFQTLAASVVSLAALYGITRGVSEHFGGISYLTLPQIAAFLGTALLLGMVGSYLALRQVFKGYPV